MTEPPTAQGVTVVVPTRNRDAYVADLLRDLVAQDHRPLEILVVDQSDGASPLTEAVASAHPELVTLFRAAFRNVATARNWGWQRARYDAIMYIDDDARCQPNLVTRHLTALMLPGVGMVAGAVDEVFRAPNLRDRVGTYSTWTATAKSGFGSARSQWVDHVLGTNYSAWRHVIQAVGGYDERLAVPPSLYEETEVPVLARLAGYCIWFDADARVKHLAAPSGGNRAPDMSRYVHNLAHNRSIMIRRHSRWYQWPVALAWSGKLIAAYTLHARDPRLIVDGARGAIQGWRAGGKLPICTRFEPASVA